MYKRFALVLGMSSMVMINAMYYNGDKNISFGWVNLTKDIILQYGNSFSFENNNQVTSSYTVTFGEEFPFKKLTLSCTDTNRILGHAPTLEYKAIFKRNGIKRFLFPQIVNVNGELLFKQLENMQPKNLHVSQLITQKHLNDLAIDSIEIGSAISNERKCTKCKMTLKNGDIAYVIGLENGIDTADIILQRIISGNQSNESTSTEIMGAIVDSNAKATLLSFITENMLKKG